MTRKIQITAQVTRDVAEKLEHLAAQRNLSLSACAAELLEKAVVREIEEAEQSLLMPMIEEVVRAEFKKGFERMARLLVRNALESGTTHRLVVYLMTAWFENAQLVNGMDDQFWKKSAEALRTPLKDLPELIEVASSEGREAIAS